MSAFSKSQATPDKALTTQGETVLASCLAQIVQKYPDLARLIEAWPDLPEHIKAAIKALVQTHNKGGE